MKIVIPRERANGETRVAATPETVQKLTASGYKLKVETDVGKASGFQNEDYYKAGAEIAERTEDLYAEDAIILKIRPPLDNEESWLHKGHILVANFQAYPYTEPLKHLAARGISAVALDKIPRIARAQSMDVLSSQSSLNGYAAVLTAAGNPVDDDRCRNSYAGARVGVGCRSGRVAGNCYRQAPRSASCRF